MLDESSRCCSTLGGEKFSFEGKHYTVRDAQFLPVLCRGRGFDLGWRYVASQAAVSARRPFRRHLSDSGDIETPLMPSQVRDLVAFIKSVRTSDAPFDVIQSGNTTGENAEQDRTIVAPYEEAGATWWFESRVPWQSSVEKCERELGWVRPGCDAPL